LMQALGCGLVGLALVRHGLLARTDLTSTSLRLLYRFACACLTALKDHVRQHSA